MDTLVHPLSTRGHICRRRKICMWMRAALLAVDCAGRAGNPGARHSVFYCGRRRVKWRLLIYTDSLAGSALLIKGAAPTGRRRLFISPQQTSLPGIADRQKRAVVTRSLIHNNFVQKVTRTSAIQASFIILICTRACISECSKIMPAMWEGIYVVQIRGYVLLRILAH